MNKHFKILFFLFIIYGFKIHPFNISVTEIHINETKNNIQITSRYFIDDLEDAYNLFYREQTNITDSTKSQFIDSLNTYYMKYHFNLNINDEDIELFYIGKEYDDDTMIMYFEIYNVKNVNKITIFNNALMASFDEQTNLIHIYKNSTFLKTLKLTNNKIDDEYLFN